MFSTSGWVRFELHVYNR